MGHDVGVKLLDPLVIGTHEAPSRVVLGPHETNLGDRRAISSRHVAYYRRRAAGGAGVIVIEEASVHPSDWPYERAPLASDCEAGWAEVAEACHAEGALVLAALEGARCSRAASLIAAVGVLRIRVRPAPVLAKASPQRRTCRASFLERLGMALTSIPVDARSPALEQPGLGASASSLPRESRRPRAEDHVLRARPAGCPDEITVHRLERESRAVEELEQFLEA